MAVAEASLDIKIYLLQQCIDDLETRGSKVHRFMESCVAFSVRKKKQVEALR